MYTEEESRRRDESIARLHRAGFTEEQIAVQLAVEMLLYRAFSQVFWLMKRIGVGQAELDMLKTHVTAPPGGEHLVHTGGMPAISPEFSAVFERIRTMLEKT